MAAKTTSRFGEVTQLEFDAATVCDDYPYLKLEKGAVLYSNLGNQGPDSGQGEGMVLLTKDVGGGAASEYGHEIKVIVNATDAPVGAFDPVRNGRSGEYMQIAVMSGHDVRIDVKFVEANTGKSLTVPKYAVSFFDLDCAKGMQSKESVTIGGYAHYKTSSQTEVKVTEEGSATKFSASTVGRWDDGPTNPHFLTQQQKNRAVSLLFHGKSEFHFVLSAAAGEGARFFNIANGPSTYCAVTVQKGAGQPLPDLPVHPPTEHPVISRHGETFMEFLTEKGDAVEKGDPLYKVTDRSGEERTYRAPSDGVVVAVQDELKRGDQLDQRIANRVIVVVWQVSLAPLPVDALTDDEPQGKDLSKDSTFEKYLKNQWDPVHDADDIFVVADSSGKETVVKATASGVVKARQERLKSGESLDLVADGNLMTIGKLEPLPVGDGASPLVILDDLDGGLEFVRYAAKEGEVVETGSTIAIVRSPDGSERSLKSGRPGVVTGIHEHLAEGMVLKGATKDKALAIIGPLPPMEVRDGQQAVVGPDLDGWKFDGWLAEVGDLVEEGDPICRLRGTGGLLSTRTVKAPRTGTVEARQEHLRRGDPLDAIADSELAVIGKIAATDMGMFEEGVTAPGHAVFERWLAQDGEQVRFMQPIGEVSIPARRLVEADGTVRRLAASTMQLLAPGSGSVSWIAPLMPGETVGSQQTGGTIAKVYLGPPWWLFLLFSLMVLCCLLCALFQVMKKPMPYAPMEPEPPAPEPPAPEPEPVVEPEGVRLDFDENGTIHTVYATYRPLGIKHNELAPIVAHDFTLNSYAKMELKVQEGWKLSRIADEELGGSTDFAHISHKLAEKLKDYPLWPLPLVFKKQGEDAGAEEVTVKFVERPLGLEFSNHAPIEIKKVYEDSPAQAAGIEVGWLLTRIGEYDVHSNSNFRDVMKHFKEGVEAVDDSGKTYTT